MFLLLLIFWFFLYHGFVLWLALRFRAKPWRWYWFGAVVTIGLTVAWFDQFYIRYVVIGHYCEKDKDQLGFHEYEPAVVTADKVTWLWKNEPGYNGPPRTHPGTQRKVFEQDGFHVRTSNSFICRKANGDTFYCLADGYVQVDKYRPLSLFGWDFAGHNSSQLMRDETVVRQVVNYAWSGSKFFSFIIPDLNIDILYDNRICGMDINEVRDTNPRFNFHLTVVE